MTALEFIKKYGWGESSVIVFESIEYGANTFYDTHDELYYGQIKDIRVSVTDIKQYVDAWELVKSYGGLKQSKMLVCIQNNYELEKAIELVEQVNASNKRD